MTVKALEQSVIDLQKRVTELEIKMESESGQSWQETVGAAGDDTHFSEAMRLGAECRRKANREDW